MKCVYTFLLFFLSLPVYSSGEWWESTFVIGTYFDPPVDSILYYQQAQQNGFNLFTGTSQNHKYVKYEIILEKYNDISKDSILSQLHFFRPMQLDLPQATNYCGIFIKDEPTLDDVATVSQLVNQYDNNNFLCLVNLLPCYGFHGNANISAWDEYCNYLNVYCDTLNLPVLCFDNYYQDSFFSVHDPTYQGATYTPHQYFSNLAEMRRRAGNRPLWSTVNVTEWITQYTPARQQAYMRIGAFAPMCYGYKGLLYYSYDCAERNVVVRDLNYRTDCNWDEGIFYHPVHNSARRDVFYGYFNRNGNSQHADIAVKTDDADGSWWIKYAPIDTSERFVITANDTVNKEWDLHLTCYGTSDYTHPFVTDWNSDGWTDLGTLNYDGLLLIDTQLGSWTNSLYLSGINSQRLAMIGHDGICTGNFSGGTNKDICIVFGDTVCLYSYNTAGGTTPVSSTDTIFPGLVQIMPDGDSVLYAVSYDNAQWTSNQCSYNIYLHRYTPTSGWSKNNYGSLQARDLPSHGWLEHYKGDNGLADSLVLFLQDRSGMIYFNRVRDGGAPTCLSPWHQWKHNSAREYRACGVKSKNGSNSSYDLYCEPDTMLLRDALLDDSQQPTARYSIASDVNSFLHQYVAPVVTGWEWKECVHSDLPDIHVIDSLDNHVDFVSNDSVFIQNLSACLMAGVFFKAASTSNERDSLCIIVLNKSDQDQDNAYVCLYGNHIGGTGNSSTPFIMPRINAGGNAYSAVYDFDHCCTRISWPAMKGGEYILIKTAVRNVYPSHHRTCNFDSDNKADID